MVQRSFIVSLAVLVWSSAAWAQEDAPVTVPPVAPDSAPAAAPFRIVLSPEARLQLSDADRARAAALESEGQTLYASGRYKEAIDKFKLAFEITQNPGVLYNIGLSHQQLESWQECVGYMERFLEKEAPGAKRDRAENTLKSCDARIERDQATVGEARPSVGSSSTIAARACAAAPRFATTSDLARTRSGSSSTDMSPSSRPSRSSGKSRFA